MNIETIIKLGIDSVEKEHQLIDTMLSFIENGDISKFREYTDYFGDIRLKTDEIIDTLLDNYSEQDIFDYLDDNQDFRCDFITFYDLLKTAINNRKSRKKHNIDSDSMSEEYYKELFGVYLWGIKSEEFSLEEKGILHDFMLPSFTSSRFIRTYFSGNYKKAMSLSTPEISFGRPIADSMALVEYCSRLNDIVNQSNRSEMFDDIESPDIFNARRKYLKYELVAITNLMEKRAIAYPVLPDEPSDFTYNLLRDASTSVNELNKDNTVRKIITTIYY